jgi:membrane-associated phospholipid phosphatase
MFAKKTLLFILIYWVVLLPVFSQISTIDTTSQKFTLKKAIIPAVLIGAGFAVKSANLKAEQLEWQQKYFSNFKTHAEDIFQYSPYVAAFGLDWVGVKSKHRFADKLGVMVVGGVMMFTVVEGLKRTTKITRPDGSNNDAFPSGHTANAFFGATILSEEYGDQSVWYTIGGYSVATATGAFRILNNRHWVSDVLVGAGIGILSGKVAYAVYPWIKQKLHLNKSSAVSVVPIFDGQHVGASISMGF